jgi:uncharacterized membrane protein YhaH (DUF805 family)/Tfp pilus assembly protein PilE
MATNNPYQTPQGQLESDDDLVYGEVKFFSPSSRINRLRYWAHSMLFMLGAYALLALGGVVAAMVSWTAGLIIMIPVYIVMIVYSFILIIQRLHDLNKSGWMSLLMLVPLANIYLFILIIFFKGTPGRNDYGLQTPPNKTWHWILALVTPIVMIGILAAVAIPAYNAYVKQMSGQAEQFNDQMEQYSPDAEYPAVGDPQPDMPMPEDNYNQQNSTEQMNDAENAYPAAEENPYQEAMPEEQYQNQAEPEYPPVPVDEASTYDQSTYEQPAYEQPVENYNETYQEPAQDYSETPQYE